MKTPSKISIAFAALACGLLAATPIVQAQDWHGQDSEFGSIRAPYSVTMDGTRVQIEARIVLRENYEDRDSRFFMFAFSVENTPLDIRFENLVRMDTGEELPCYQREGGANSAIKCAVDLRYMPDAGTEIRMSGSAGSSRSGMFQVGSMVVPFTYTWTRLQMSNNLPAELYAGTQVNVVKGTAGDGFGGSGNGMFAKIPGVETLGVVVAASVAVVVVSIRRKAR